MRRLLLKGERVDVKMVELCAVGHEVVLRFVDHGRRSAQVDAVLGEIGKVGEHRLLHVAAPAAPRVVGTREHRHVLELVEAALPGAEHVVEVEVGLGSHAPIEPDRRAIVVVEQRLEHALDRCDAGAGGHHQERAVVALVQAEGAERELDVEALAGMDRRQRCIGEAAAGDAPDMEVEDPRRPGTRPWRSCGACRRPDARSCAARAARRAHRPRRSRGSGAARRGSAAGPPSPIAARRAGSATLARPRAVLMSSGPVARAWQSSANPCAVSAALSAGGASS